MGAKISLPGMKVPVDGTKDGETVPKALFQIASSMVALGSPSNPHSSDAIFCALASPVLGRDCLYRQRPSSGW